MVEVAEVVVLAELVDDSVSLPGPVVQPPCLVLKGLASAAMLILTKPEETKTDGSMLRKRGLPRPA